MRTSRRLTCPALGVVVALVAGCSVGDGDPTPPPTTSTVPLRSTSRPASSPAPAVVSAPGVDRNAWRSVDGAARRVAQDVALLAGFVTPSGQLQIVHRSGPVDTRPIASVTKLYVMIALLDAIRAGRLRWDQSLTLLREDICAGSGSMAGRGVGVRIRVMEAAGAMFKQSDNTATSLLVRVLGQDAMKAALRASGHSRPDLMIPFLTIREDLWLLYSPDPAAQRARAGWAKASETGRRQLIAPSRRADASGPDFSIGGSWRSGLGYFASSEDVARAWVALHTRAKASRSTLASQIMAVPSPGFTAPRAWTTVWFKSGALGGVENGTWYSPAPEGDQVIVVLASGGPTISGVRSLATKAADELERYARKR
ncbi:hypothetical protein EU513_01690 [Yimella sp. RIT 621]|uniref:serine hydrolase n=1 Tax=Yimella sp. RIT 621 TaxID=2510323 RepID=UPI00101D9238|nr:serine hydrolase [Yimella sp. RIT 621]RYG79017.1 hypothetical protein EU513_01690 [Yimella sp. RIT 621]